MTHASRIAAAIAAVGVLAGGVASPAAADIVDDGHPGYVTIETATRSLESELSPGDSAYWAMSVALDAPSDGDLHSRLFADGPLVASSPGVNVELRECSVSWSVSGGGAVCAGTEQEWIASMPFADRDPSQLIDLGVLANHGVRHFLVGISLDEDTPDELMGLHAEYRVEFSAAGDTESIGNPPRDPDTPLVLTGVAVAAPLLLAVGLAAGGAILAAAARRRRPEVQA